MVVAGGWSGVRRRGEVTPGTELAAHEEHPSQARNVDLVPTSAWLLGLNPPPGDFDGVVREDAFSARPHPRVAVRNVASMPVVTRVAGADSRGTVVELSRLAFPDGAGAVVVVSDQQPAHALAAVPLAARRGGPVLASAPDTLPTTVAAEVRRLGARTAFLLGGVSVLAPRVEEDLRRAGVEEVVRLAGEDPFATARLVAAELGVDESNRQVVLLHAAYVDEAVIAGPVAAAGHPRTPVTPTPLAAFTAGGGTSSRPVLLTERDRLPEQTASALRDLAIDRVVVVGGPGAVSTAVEEELRAQGAVVERIGARRADETGALLAERGFREGAFSDDIYLVGMGQGIEGVAAGAALGRLGGSLVLCPPQRLAQAAASRALLHDRADEFVRVRVVGSERSISRQAVDDVVALLLARRTRAGS